MRLVVTLLPPGGVKAKAIDVELEVTADNVAELRDKLSSELEPFGCEAALIGIRSDPEKPRA